MFKPNYYYLVAGLPDITLEDNKLSMGLSEFKTLATEQLSVSDMNLLKTFFWRYDNSNIKNRLEENDQPHINTANLSESQVQDILKLAKNNSLHDFEQSLPSYLQEFLTAYYQSENDKNLKYWELQLTSKYYHWAEQCNNGFMAHWYATERHIRNLVTTTQARKYNYNPTDELIGDDEITENLARSNARDFGLAGDFPRLGDFLKALELDEILSREKQIDHLKWEILNEESFFYYFSIERVFAFMLKLVWVERWVGLDPEHGRNMFEKLISELEESYELPKEY